jgi:cytochrome P450
MVVEKVGPHSQSNAASVPVAARVPSYDIDYYADEVIRDPYPHYAAMRALGPVVFLPRLGNYATTQYAETRAGLQDWRAFSSTLGVAGDKVGCEFLLGGGSNIVRDPPLHDEIRAKMARPLLPQSLKNIRGQVQDAAAGLIERLVKAKSFDGMTDLASYLPLTLVTELLGLPEDGRKNMLHWAAGAFDITGIQNERGKRGIETIEEMRDWVMTKVTPEALKPGGLIARIRGLIEAGELSEEYFLSIMNDYLTPSLDTTISATGHLLYHLGRNPDQWALLKGDPSLIPNAINETVRISAPIRSFTRHLTTDYAFGDVVVPAGARVMMMYASANRDERKFPNPDSFDVARSNAREHLGFGHGIHLCVGMHLARLEMESLLSELVRRVDRIEVGEPTMVLNNSIHAFEKLPVTLHG